MYVNYTYLHTLLHTFFYFVSLLNIIKYYKVPTCQVNFLYCDRASDHQSAELTNLYSFETSRLVISRYHSDLSTNITSVHKSITLLTSKVGPHLHKPPRNHDRNPIPTYDIFIMLWLYWTNNGMIICMKKKTLPF